MGKLFSKTVLVKDLSQSQIEDMYRVFSKYYLNTDRFQFEKDLSNKEAVFLLIDKKNKNLQGFSTIMNLNVEIGGKNYRGVFSGDTVVEKKYWGQGTLGKAFLFYLFIQKLKKPFSPLYWYLISKGYKTYLLMANNFSNHYPRFEHKTPQMEQQILDAFSDTLYGNYYDKDSGLINFSDAAVVKDCLKDSTAPISEEMMLKNNRIRFFAESNPQWESGNELACIAKMTLYMPFYYQLKYMKKFTQKMLKKVFPKKTGEPQMVSR